MANRASTAQYHATRRAARPKPAKLTTHRTLRGWVIHGLHRQWSPRQIAATLKRTFPGQPGLSDPVPVGLLAELAEHYLDARGGATLRPEALYDAESWARTPARGASSLLIPTGGDRVLAFDYLIDLATEPVPVPVWLGVVAWCSPEQALGVGLTARRLSRFEAADAAFTKAAGADLPGAKTAQAELIGSGGNPRRGRATDRDLG